MKDRIYSTLAENIRFARLQRGISQEELAERVNVSTNYIYQIESGRTRVGLSVLLKIKEVLSIAANQLFSEEEFEDDNRQELKEVIFIMKNASEGERIILLDTIRSIDASFKKIQI